MISPQLLSSVISQTPYLFLFVIPHIILKKCKKNNCNAILISKSYFLLASKLWRHFLKKVRCDIMAARMIGWS